MGRWLKLFLMQLFITVVAGGCKSFTLGLEPPVNEASSQTSGTSPQIATESYPVQESITTLASHLLPAGYPASLIVESDPVSISICPLSSPSSDNLITPMLDTFTFSDPEIILTSTTGIHVFEWLPDSRRLLLSIPYQTIEDKTHHIAQTLDVVTGETVVYASELYPVRAMWLAEQQAVVYETRSEDSQEPYPTVWLSQGEGLPPQLLARDFVSHVTYKPGGYLTYFVTDSSLKKLSMTNYQEQDLVTDLTNWRSQIYLNFQQINPQFAIKNYQIAWHPDGSKLILHQFPVIFLYDMNENEVCQIDLGTTESITNWALKAEWSSDGRYLALITTSNNGGPMHSISFTNLTIIDFKTNIFRTFQPSPAQFVSDFVWSPDSRYLAVIGAVQKGANSQEEKDGLFIVDVSNGASQQVLPDYEFGEGTFLNHAWSSDGSQLAITCPLITDTLRESRLCLISVESN